ALVGGEVPSSERTAKRGRLSGPGDAAKEVGDKAKDVGLVLHGAAAARLVGEVSLAALETWVASPGSDVEKALRKAMRARHSELWQAARAAIARRVLGVAVLRGRLAHLLEREVGAGSGQDAELLLELFIARELPQILGNVGELPEDWEAEPPSASARLGTAAAAAPLFRADEQPTAAVELAATWSLPSWLAERWVQELGSDTAFALGRAMTRPSRITLRANALKTSRQELMERLAAAGVRSLPTSESPWGLWLPDGRPPGGGVWQLPGWSEGLFEVQDEGSQLIALATEAQPGEHAVDYCAGRGGKTWLLTALVAPHGKVLAWDVDGKLRQQLRGSKAKGVGAADLVQVPEDRPFVVARGSGEASAGTEDPEVAHAGIIEGVDVALVDAPCSSCGALRRHPSQRWALKESDVEQLQGVQLQVLQEASALVRPGGRLVYATCSLLHAENGAIAEAFEASALGQDFEPWPFLRKDKGKDAQSEAAEVVDSAGPEDGPRRPRPAHHRMLLPHVEGTDGFFMARWRRRCTAAVDSAT
ncbi:unnamed protein product, partial [Polarella glacialis]